MEGVTARLHFAVVPHTTFCVSNSPMSRPTYKWVVLLNVKLNVLKVLRSPGINVGVLQQKKVPIPLSAFDAQVLHCPQVHKRTSTL